jgi:hypothetical protein
VAKIKILEQECINMCNEGTCIWIELTTNPELQALEEKIRTTQEQAHQANERANTLPPTKRMTTLLANMKLYIAVEQLKEEQRKIAQELQPRHDEAIMVLEELPTAQSITTLAT